MDILVANAALPGSGRLESFSMEQIDRALDVNLRAPIALAHALAPAMVERGSGHLLFVSSLSGKTAAPGSSLYNATKYGLRGFAAALRAELRDSGVGVSAVFPGFIRDAGMFADSGAKLPPGVGTRIAAGRRQGRGERDRAQPRRGGRRAGGTARGRPLRRRRPGDGRRVHPPDGRREGRRADHRGPGR